MVSFSNEYLDVGYDVIQRGAKFQFSASYKMNYKSGNIVNYEHFSDVKVYNNSNQLIFTIPYSVVNGVLSDWLNFADYIAASRNPLVVK